MAASPDLTGHDEEMLIAALGPEPATPFASYVVRSGQPGAELARRVEQAVFAEVFGNSPALLDAEYGPFEDASLYFLLVDHRRRAAAGAVRVILPGPAGCKTAIDLATKWGQPSVVASHGIDLDDAWDVATLAVAADYRKRSTQGLVSMALYQALCTTAAHSGVHWFLATLDLVVLDLIQTELKEPMSTFDGVAPQRYLDSPLSLPVWSDQMAWAQRLSRQDPDLFELLIRGHGLEAAVTPPNWAMAATAAGSRVSSSSETEGGSCAEPLQGRGDVCSGRWTGEQVALPDLTAEAGDADGLCGRLDAFGHGAHAERCRHGDDGGDEAGLGAVGGVEAFHEGPVDLHDVDREALQVGQ